MPPHMQVGNVFGAQMWSMECLEKRQVSHRKLLDDHIWFCSAAKKQKKSNITPINQEMNCSLW